MRSNNLYLKREQEPYMLINPYLKSFLYSIVESILLFKCVVWFGACRKEDFKGP